MTHSQTVILLYRHFDASLNGRNTTYLGQIIGIESYTVELRQYAATVQFKNEQLHFVYVREKNDIRIL